MTTVSPRVGDNEREGNRADAFQLKPVTPEDLAWIDGAVDRWHGSLRWSIADQMPALAEVQARVWDDVAAQRTVWHPSTGPVALLQLVDVNLYNGVAGLELLVAPHAVSQLQSAVTGFVDRGAVDLPLRKLTFGCASGALPVRELTGGRAVPVGCYRNHEKVAGGRYRDIDLYELWCAAGDDP